MWECFDGLTDGQNPYVCSHMAQFAKACEEELTRTFGSTELVRGGESCRRVQDGCTGGGGETGLQEYYIQFPVLLEHDKCADVLAAEGGGPFLDRYDAQCSDADGCSAELSQVRALCADPAAAGNLSCADRCKSAIDGLFSSADGGASWALCQGVRVPVSAEVAPDVFDGGFLDKEYYGYGRRLEGYGGEGYGGEALEGGESRQPRQLRASTGSASSAWTTFGREAVSLYNTYHFKGCGGGRADSQYATGYDSGESCALQGDHRESSLLLTVALLMLGCCGGLHLVMARADAAGPLGRPLDARLAAAPGGAQSASSEREATARRFNSFVRAMYILSLCAVMSSWACVWLPVGMVGGITGMIAASIGRTNLRNLLSPVGSDGHTPTDCCGDVGGTDRTRWLEPVASLQITTAVLCGIGALINLLFGSFFVKAGHEADGGYCYQCPATSKVFCDWRTCFEACGCASENAYSCCADLPCSTGAGECGAVCQYGALALLSVLFLVLLMGVSIGGLSASHALRRSWRHAHAPANGEVVLSTLGPPVEAVVVQAVPMAAEPMAASATATPMAAVPMASFEQPGQGACMPPTAVATAVGVRQS